MSPAAVDLGTDESGPAPLTVLWCERADSTQDVARGELAAGRPAPFAIATDEQTAGRGRLSRTWSLPAGAGLALTLAHAPSCGPAQRTWYPLVAALAAVAELRSCGADVTCKWPNDILDGTGRKIAGILVEGVASGEILVGIGVNLRGPVRDAEGIGLPAAVALDELLPGTGGAAGSPPVAAAPVDARDLARRLSGRLLAELAALDAVSGDGVRSGHADRYRETCVTLGRRVRIEPLGRSAARPESPGTPGLTGEAVDIDEHGRLLVRCDGPAQPGGGTVRAVDVGDVHHVRAAAAAAGPESRPHGRIAGDPLKGGAHE